MASASWYDVVKKVVYEGVFRVAGDVASTGLRTARNEFVATSKLTLRLQNDTLSAVHLDRCSFKYEDRCRPASVLAAVVESSRASALAVEWASVAPHEAFGAVSNVVALEDGVFNIVVAVRPAGAAGSFQFQVWAGKTGSPGAPSVHDPNSFSVDGWVEPGPSLGVCGAATVDAGPLTVSVHAVEGPTPAMAVVLTSTSTQVEPAVLSAQIARMTAELEATRAAAAREHQAALDALEACVRDEDAAAQEEARAKQLEEEVARLPRRRA